MSQAKMTEQEVKDALGQLEGWAYDAARPAIQKQFLFSDFKEAFAFMTKAAMFAEEICHHPEWSNVYNRVNVVLTTHDSGGVTALDVKTATVMNRWTA